MSNITIDVKNDDMLGRMNDGVIATKLYSLEKALEEKDKEIERLKEELKYTIPIVEHNKTITKHLKEIERLNNIINELERYLEEQWLEWKDCETDVRFMANEDKCILEKLRELKGE